MIVLWCNGSTAVFGSACLGSSPGKTTQIKESSINRLTPWFFYTLPSTPIEPRLQHVESSKLLLGIAPQFLFISTFSCEIYAPASQVEYRMGLGVISLVTLIAFIRYEIIIPLRQHAPIPYKYDIVFAVTSKMEALTSIFSSSAIPIN